MEGEPLLRARVVGTAAVLPLGWGLVQVLVVVVPGY